MSIRCASKTDFCKQECGQLVPKCWKGRGKGKCKKGMKMPCLCSKPADGHRDVCQCAKEVVQSSSHFRCVYALRVIIRGPDFSKAEIHEGEHNKAVHPPGQVIPAHSRKVPERLKEDIHVARIQNRIAPRQYLACQYPRCDLATHLHVLMCLCSSHLQIAGVGSRAQGHPGGWQERQLGGHSTSSQGPPGQAPQVPTDCLCHAPLR